ncbi:MAG: LrgB family protein [Bacteroidales bacterium]
MDTLTNTHIFGIFISVGFFYLFNSVKSRFSLNWLNPLLFSTAAIICLLLLAKIPYEHYTKGGNVIHALLGPVTVVLAVPLYRQRELMFRYKYCIGGGILLGVISAIVSVIIFSRLLDINEILERSLIPHSVTTPIGISLSNMLDAKEGITIVAVMITGIFGAMTAPLFFRLLGIKHPVAKGLSMGTSSHALGTSKAIEMGETEGAMSSLGIGVTALTTVFVVIVMQLMGWY